MPTYSDKDKIRFWMRLYNRLVGETYTVESWPDDDSSKQNIDALCRNSTGQTLAIEHTLIEPFAGDKADADPFLQVLGPLENHPRLTKEGYRFTVSQRVGGSPRGVKWAEVSEGVLLQLAPMLPTLDDGMHEVTVKGSGWTLDLYIDKAELAPTDPGKFFVSRIYPGDPGPELIIKALEKKIPKLAAATADMKILLLDKDAVAGTIEAQLELLPDEPRIQTLLNSIHQTWGLNSAALENESVIFTNRIYPLLDEFDEYLTRCSLNVETDMFWQVPR